jgi:nuclear pore complex protein Nup93
MFTQQQSSQPQASSLWSGSTAVQSPASSQGAPRLSLGLPSQGQSGGPFSGFSLGQSQQQQQQQQPAQSASRLGFGVSQSQQQQPLGSSLLNPPSTSQPQQPGLFGTSGVASTKQQDQGQRQSPSQPAFFDSLLERSRQRNKDVNGTSTLAELPSLQLGLGDIARRVKQLGGPAAAQQGRTTDNKAYEHLHLSRSQ